MLKEMIETGKTTYEEVEAAIKNMKIKIEEYKQMHFNDQAEIVRLRRMVEALEEKA